MKLSAFVHLFLLSCLAWSKLVFGANHLRGSIKSLDAAVDGEGDDYEQVLRHLDPGEQVPEAFIVEFDDSVEDVKGMANALIKQFGGVQGFVYEHSIKGFSVKRLPEAQAAKLAASPGVKHVEPDQVVTAGGKPPTKPPRPTEPPTLPPTTPPPTLPPTTPPPTLPPTQPPQPPQMIPWGIVTVRANGTAAYTGNNSAWVIDTGIDLDHPDLNVNSTRCKFFIETSCEDGNGHGTQ